MADPYGLSASGLPPELAAQLMGLTREQAIAQALMQQSQQPLAAPQAKGRFEVPIGPLSAIAKVAQAYMAKQGVAANDQKFADFSGQVNNARLKALSDYSAARDGSPAQNIPYPQGLTADDEGNAMPPAVKPAVPGDARAAIAQALMNPLLASNPLVSADLKSYEKAQDPYSLKPGEQRMQGTTKVAAAPLAPKEVTVAGANGSPEIRFVTPDASAPAMPAPVKQEMVNTGKVNVGVNPYQKDQVLLANTTSPNADQSASVAIRGQNMTDTRQRELNGILDGTSGNIENVAQAIANHDMAAPSPSAMRTPAAMNRLDSVIARVKQINPDWSAQDFTTSQKALNDFATGKNGNSVRSLSVATDHLGTLKDAATALNNGDLPALNKVAQIIAQQTGEPAPTTFDAMKKIVGDEVVKAIVGSGGGVEDRRAAQETLSRAASPQQLSGVVDGYLKLFGGQLGGLRRQYEVNTKRKDFEKFLSDAAKQQIPGASATAPGASPAGNKPLFDAADAILGGK